jgi:hypothetical protein
LQTIDDANGDRFVIGTLDQTTKDTEHTEEVAVLNAAMLGLDKEVGGRRMQVFPDLELRLDQ